MVMTKTVILILGAVGNDPSESQKTEEQFDEAQHAISSAAACLLDTVEGVRPSARPHTYTGRNLGILDPCLLFTLPARKHQSL
jgi:hypothetical protein